MTHEYSKFKNKNIPYAKVGRRVFNSLFDAETFCTEHGLDVNSAIEYRDDPELKNNIQTIAQYQKAILQECLDRLKAVLKPWFKKSIGVMLIWKSATRWIVVS